MPLAGTTVWEVRTTGSDTANGGAFDPGQTAGMFTDGAATVATGSSPVFTSASYSFVAGDVGDWLYIASGTNWTPGWYQIASVSAGAATLTAGIGTAVLATWLANTAAGCATTASPTGATWSIDYSQVAAAAITYTDLASTGAGLTVSSAGNPFGKQQVGNSIVVTGGTNFTTGRYVIASVAAGVATVVGAANITTGVGASGTGGLGGCVASPTKVASHWVGQNVIWVKNGTYQQTATLTPPAGVGGKKTRLFGYNSLRGDLFLVNDFTNFPTLQNNNVTSAIITCSNDHNYTANFILDGGSGASKAANCVTGVQSWCWVENIKGINWTNQAFNLNYGQIRRCWATSGISGADSGFVAGGQAFFYYCVSSGNPCKGFRGASSTVVYLGCISYGNTTANGHGFTSESAGCAYINCTSYNNAGSGFWFSGANSTLATSLNNCISVSNGGYGVNSVTVSQSNPASMGNAFYNNTSGATINWPSLGNVTLTGDPFTNGAAGDFSLNNTAGAGASCRAVGFPGVMPGGLSTGYADMGAVQHQDAGGGGGSVAFSTIGRMIG